MGDNRVNTSDGIFVFTGDSQVVVTISSVGNLLEVSGTVNEFLQSSSKRSLLLASYLNWLSFQFINPLLCAFNIIELF